MNSSAGIFTTYGKLSIIHKYCETNVHETNLDDWCAVLMSKVGYLRTYGSNRTIVIDEMYIWLMNAMMQETDTK